MMASMMCDDSVDEWILYKDREEWKDLSPIEQDDGPNAVVAIAYSEKFKDVYDYFRAILQKGEKSERALLLTADAIELNPANYTVWQYRRTILRHLNKDLREELAYTRRVIEGNYKNYQVWHHRKLIVEWLGDASQEFRFTEIILSEDPKNYHAWQHRQWILKTFRLFDGELEFVNDLIEEDVRNNSAWNQRYFVISETTGFTEDIINREIDYALKSIKKVQKNESSWNYLRGVIENSDVPLCKFTYAITVCREFYSNGSKSSHLLLFLVNVIEDEIEHGIGNISDKLDEGIKILDSLINDHDPIRREYWKYLQKRLSFKAASKQQNGDAGGDGERLRA